MDSGSYCINLDIRINHYISIKYTNFLSLVSSAGAGFMSVTALLYRQHFLNISSLIKPLRRMEAAAMSCY